MNIVRSVIILIISGFCSLQCLEVSYASRPEWMDKTLDGLATFFSSCLERPESDGIEYNNFALNMNDDNNRWIATGIRVRKNKMMKFEWNTLGVITNPSKYQVLYRIDPRFQRPQIFIQRFDYDEKKYKSDFHSFKDGQLLRYQERPEIDFQNRKQDFSDYFNFVGRTGIQVSSGDVVNVSIDPAESFFSSGGEFSSEYSSLGGADPVMLYTDSALSDNRVVHVNVSSWCSFAGASDTYCSGDTANYHYYLTAMLVGLPKLSATSGFNISSIAKCADTQTGLSSMVCYYDDGHGVRFSISGNTIKTEDDAFVTSNISGAKFINYVSDSNGILEINSSWHTADIAPSFDEKMIEWPESTYADLMITYNSLFPTLPFQIIHFGRYFFNIEVGDSDSVINPDDERAIKMYFYIQPDGSIDIPNNGVSGTEIGRNYSVDAPNNGYLWVRMTKPKSEIGGSLTLKTAAYKGSSWFSDIVYGDLIKPLRDKYNEISELIYRKFVTNATLQRIARTALILYIIIYALMFLAGTTKISVTDIVSRVLKIAVILALFSPTSWEFFNDNLFKIFVEGSDYLLTKVVGITSSNGNIFGFVDPIIDRYTNGRFWALLFIQLLQIQNGLCFFAILTIYSILIYFRGLLEVIISYCLAFLALAVLISLAPFFITLMLFERTKGMFDAWLSSLFNYMIQPTILLIFFLLIDQLMAAQITNIVVKACWGILIPLKFGLDLHHIGIPLSFTFSLPFLPGIPFFVSQVNDVGDIGNIFTTDGTFLTIASSAFLFYAYAKMSSGLTQYVALVVQMLTNVLAARVDGELQRRGSPVDVIKGDIAKLASPVTGAVRSVGKFGKEKLIDQKYDNRENISQPDYRKLRVEGEDIGKIGEDLDDKVNNTGNNNVANENGSRVEVSADAKVADSKVRWQGVSPSSSAIDKKLSSNIKIGGNRSGSAPEDKVDKAVNIKESIQDTKDRLEEAKKNLTGAKEASEAQENTSDRVEEKIDRNKSTESDTRQKEEYREKQQEKKEKKDIAERKERLENISQQEKSAKEESQDNNTKTLNKKESQIERDKIDEIEKKASSDKNQDNPQNEQGKIEQEKVEKRSFSTDSSKVGIGDKYKTMSAKEKSELRKIGRRRIGLNKKRETQEPREDKDDK